MHSAHVTQIIVAHRRNGIADESRRSSERISLVVIRVRVRPTTAIYTKHQRCAFRVCVATLRG